MTCKCMAAKIAEQYAMRAGLCQSLSIDYICKMCNSTSKIYTTHYGNGDSDFATKDYECAECHSYIRYIEQDILYKEEYYFNDHYIINADDKFLYRKNDDKIGKYIYLPAFEFNDKEHLI